MKKIFIIIIISIFTLIFISGCSYNKEDIGNLVTGKAVSSDEYSKSKILYIDSYHEGYEWSDGITAGIRSVLEDTGIELKVHRMDTKRNPSEEFKKESAIKAKAVIDDYGPDVLITSDDNAFKYLVMPYYKDTSLPIVFCGLNWDASIYGAPYTNTAGMVEVSLTNELIKILQEFSKGDRIGYLTADVLTERKNAEYYKKILNLEFDKAYFVMSMDGWKEKFLKLQDEVDIIIFENNAGITDWNDEQAENFVLENIRIPIGTTNPWIMQSSLVGMTKIPDEQGEWSARTSLRVIAGESPSDIPVVTNKEGKLMINLKLAEKLGITFRPDFIKNAEII